MYKIWFCGIIKESTQFIPAPGRRKGRRAAVNRKTGFYPADILLPKTELERWSVVACDQFTSDPDYWREVEERTEGVPSSAHIIFPEAKLGKVDFEAMLRQIRREMDRYQQEDVFRLLPQGMIYVERTFASGAVRHGILGRLDLEEYDYHTGSGSLIRATEGTVLDRLPPRAAIREAASLECPHILTLIDDPACCIVEGLAAEKDQMELLYHFPLMMGGGSVAGWLLTTGQQGRLMEQLEQLADPQVFSEKYGLTGAAPLVYAMGDGNHSLGAAKNCWEKIKKTLAPQQRQTHPARYALAELGNLHDRSLVFEAIHRVVFGVDHHHFLEALEKWTASRNGSFSPQRFTLLADGQEREMTIPAPEHSLTVGSIQRFLDDYLAAYGGTVDYIHGRQTVERLAREGAVGLLLPVMDKESLFPAVIQDGALPRKTFSMGEAEEKRYYLECRRILP